MTREEAIRILDPDTTKEELAGIKGYAAMMKVVDEACILAVAALREQEERRWIPVTERLPENEVDVLIAYTRKGIRGYSYSGVCTAFHTDGHTSTEDSNYNWEIDYLDMDYDEEADAYIVPEGWWETVDFGEEYSSVDAVVTHWMPMPQPPKGE